MEYVSGEILKDKKFVPGFLGFENGVVIETGKGLSPKKPLAKGLIIPKLFNAHTHLGDSFIRNKKIVLPRDVERLVGPPDGIKHQMLKKASEKEIIKGLDESIDIMIKTGVGYFIDFRENGLKGINLLKKSQDKKNITSFILSRPTSLKYDKNEIDVLLNNSDGIGLSSISDWDYSLLQKISNHTHRKKKIFAIHASERSREDIDKILDLKPDLLVHMVYASENDLIRVKEENIPIVICVRSNVFFNLKPNIDLIKKTGNTMLIGTDNAMLNSPNIIDEIIFIKKHYPVFSLEELFIMASYNTRKVLNVDSNILGSKKQTDFMVLDKKSLKPIYISRQ